jgi:hypothetical protein
MGGLLNANNCFKGKKHAIRIKMIYLSGTVRILIRVGAVIACYKARIYKPNKKNNVA